MAAIDGLKDESANKKTDIGLQQMARLGLFGKNTVLVGDMVADSELAGVLGIHCVLVPWGHNDEARLKKTGRPVAETFEELEEKLCALRDAI